MQRLSQRPPPHLAKKNTHTNTRLHTQQPPPLSICSPPPLWEWSGCLAGCPACIWRAFVWGLTRRAYGRCPSAHSSSPPPGSKACVSALWSQYNWASCAFHRMLFFCSETESGSLNTIDEIQFHSYLLWKHTNQEHLMIIIKSQTKKKLNKICKWGVKYCHNEKIHNILVLAGSRGKSMVSFTITNSCSMQSSDFRDQDLPRRLMWSLQDFMECNTIETSVWGCGLDSKWKYSV